MEALRRTPYQGVVNILRFNRHFYIVAGISISLLIFAGFYPGNPIRWLLAAMAIGIAAVMFISLLVSHYVYDRSTLYEFAWLDQFKKSGVKTILNIHAGFDETSRILVHRFPSAELKVFDFYDPLKHTEISIERARKAYPSFEGTIRINTSQLPLADESVDLIFNIFALHEIRKCNERAGFLTEQCRVLRSGGKVILVEHLRDIPNFLAYNVGFFHFLSEKKWFKNFQSARLRIENKFKITPFVNVFILTKDGSSH